MAIGENILTAALAFLGGGGAAKVLGKWLDGRKAKTRADADVALKSLEIVADEREDTQRTVKSLVDCERRCARIEALCRELSERVRVLEGENRNTSQKVLLLERQNAALHAELDGLYKDLGKARPSSRPPGPPPVPDKALRIVEDRGQRKGAPRRER